MARASGRSDASTPASPNRSRTASPAAPWRYTPSRAAAYGSSPWASSAPIVPDRTSPVPPLASAGFSNGATTTSPPGSAMTVRAPLSTTTWRHAAAASLAAATRASSSSPRSPSAAGSRPLPARSRANSPACGVRTAGRCSPSHQPSIVASDRSASASSTSGSRSSPGPDSSRRTSSAVASPGRRPGPTTRASCSWSRIRASAGSGSSSSTSSSGRPIVVASTTLAANSGWSDSGIASVTSPTPARPAARHASRAAPA